MKLNEPDKIKQLSLSSSSVSEKGAAEPNQSPEATSRFDDIPNHQLGDDQEFFIPIHDFVRFTEEEMQIIDHPAFQRLEKVYQLGQAHLVYRGATHKRMEHVLGTVWVAQKIANAVYSSHRRALKKGWGNGTRCSFDKPLSIAEIRFIRLAALLHDIGHLPAGHTLEDELGLLEPHDGDRRLDLVLKKPDWIPGVDSTKLGELIDTLYRQNIAVGNPTVTPQLILRKIISKDATVGNAALAGIRLAVCRDIVGNTICADLLDYLYRDWYHIGKPKFFDRRLFEYMQIRCDARNNIPQFVLSYGERKRPKRDVVSSILELLEARYNLGETVLFHPTKCAAAAMLERGINELYAAVSPDEKEKWLEGMENRLLAFSDEEMLKSFLDECEVRKCEAGLRLFRSLAARNIYKSVEVIYKDDLSAVEFQLIEHHYLGRSQQDRSTPKAQIQEKRKAAEIRMNALRALEKDFHLQAGRIVMYCPSRSMNSKIAKVKIIHNDAIRTLDEWDNDKHAKLAGGHCAAQLERFESLWRIEVFMCESDLENIKTTSEKIRDNDYWHLFKRAVKNGVLGVAPDPHTLAEESFLLAVSLATIEVSPYFGYKALDQKAARDFREDEQYPLGAPLLRTLLVAQ